MKSLTRNELDALLRIAARYSEHHALMFIVTFNHGLRVSETLALTGENVMNGYLVVQRLKGSKKTSQPLQRSERDGLLALAGATDGPLFPRMSHDVLAIDAAVWCRGWRPAIQMHAAQTQAHNGPTRVRRRHGTARDSNLVGAR
jgi:integrase